MAGNSVRANLSKYIVNKAAMLSWPENTSVKQPRRKLPAKNIMSKVKVKVPSLIAFGE